MACCPPEGWIGACAWHGRSPTSPARNRRVRTTSQRPWCSGGRTDGRRPSRGARRGATGSRVPGGRHRAADGGVVGSRGRGGPGGGGGSHQVRPGGGEIGRAHV